jgi:multicomponent Na+:H+ antiporter subunit E
MIARLLLFSVAWLVLTEGTASGWVLALGTVVVATLASAVLLPTDVTRWRAAGLARFVPFFLHQSFVGGLDVAWRALRPSGIRPAMIEYRLRLPDGPARRFFVAAMGLLPGTLAARLQRDHVTVHVLDTRLRAPDMLRALEARTADLFGLPRLDA